MTQYRAAPSQGLSGTVRVPGDKSISHRALILGALAAGETRVSGLLEGEDVLATAAALRAMGAGITRDGKGVWRVQGRGVGGLAEPDRVLDLGNSGTGVRLLLGVAAGQPFTTFFCGDESLSRRPMARVTEPLARMGAAFVGRSDGRLPIAVTGPEQLVPVEITLKVPSAQVKSAILLAGLHAPGETTVIEPAPARDHTERLLRRFGADVRVTALGGGNRITVTGQPELVPATVAVPGDPSSAAFVAVAALTTPDSQVQITGVGVNPLRAGVFAALRDMGADLAIDGEADHDGEPVADITARFGPLSGITVPPERIPAMIDEIPILAVAAAVAAGQTRIEGLGELRVKESDRLRAIADGMAECGVGARIDGDSLVIDGCGGPPPGGGAVAAPHDHRIAMAFLVLGLAARAPVTVDGVEAIATSFPGFREIFAGLGADIG